MNREVELAGICAALANKSPGAPSEVSGDIYCFFCSAPLPPGGAHRHEENCLWIAARRVCKLYEGLSGIHHPQRCKEKAAMINETVSGVAPFVDVQVSRTTGEGKTITVGARVSSEDAAEAMSALVAALEKWLEERVSAEVFG